MDKLKKARNFDGVVFTLSSIEFDTVIYLLKETVSFGEKHGFHESYLKPKKRLIDVLSQKSYYEEYAEDVHCMLGYYELEVFMETIIDMLPQGVDEVINFVNCLVDPNTKKWVSNK